MSDQAETESEWTIQDSAKLYQIEGWGKPYFSIDSLGHVTVRPNPATHHRVDLFELAQSLQHRGIDLPILIRFSDIVGHRIQKLNESFTRAIAEFEYGGRYRGVYPVKVNQTRHVVEAVVEQGRPWGYGLEAGSKAELLIALAKSDQGGFIVCNGYKDLSYIETALVAQQFDKTVIVVLERVEEIALAVRAARKLGIQPMLGVRARLTSKGTGRWADSTGDRAKFGLTKAELVHTVERLREEGMLDSLRLLHFHIGSQISSIMPIKTAVREAARLYVELAKLGCPMGYLDVGGGLAVDYDGSQTDFHASRNYTMQEYATDIVSEVQDACRAGGVAEPCLVTESGRAVVAHQSMLLCEVVGVSEVRFGTPTQPAPEAHRILAELFETYEGVHPKNVQESWHDATHAKEEAQSLFRYGYLSLSELAQAERLYWHCCEKILDTVGRLKVVPEELLELDRDLAAIYYCNFSIFQSAPDIWAIGQLFPIMPIHRLDEEPTVHATLADLTCDSDGRIDRFIDFEDERRTLNVHRFDPDKPYLLGIFLNGAYQEILGDMHNLFGDTNAVHVRVTDDGYVVEHVVKGDSMQNVLRYVQYAPEDMVESVRLQAERAIKEGRLDVRQMRLLMEHYESALQRYTYLTGDEEP